MNIWQTIALVILATPLYITVLGVLGGLASLLSAKAKSISKE